MTNLIFKNAWLISPAFYSTKSDFKSVKKDLTAITSFRKVMMPVFFRHSRLLISGSPFSLDHNLSKSHHRPSNSAKLQWSGTLSARKKMPV